MSTQAEGKGSESVVLESRGHRTFSWENYGLNHFYPLPESLRLTKANRSPTQHGLTHHDHLINIYYNERI